MTKGWGEKPMQLGNQIKSECFPS